MEPFKNLLNLSTITDLGNKIETNYPSFQKDDFIASFTLLNNLELKERLSLITDNLLIYMPNDFYLCKKILMSDLEANKISGFTWWAIQMFFVKKWGQQTDYLVEIINLLKKITPLSTSEFSIRYLLIDNFERTHQLLISFLNDENHHVRRWISEGTRPRLPWGVKLDIFCKNPSLNEIIIKSLQNDSSLYVRKSVANHLNDISKDNPEFVINWVKLYINEAKKDNHMMWTFRHGLRSLIKKGNKEALSLLGVNEVEYDDFKANINKSQIIKSNTSFQLINLSFHLKTESKIILDFKLRSPGKSEKEKVKIIKGKTFQASIGVNEVSKKINLFDNSVSTFHSGQYYLDIIVNGKLAHTLSWTMIE